MVINADELWIKRVYFVFEWTQPNLAAFREQKDMRRWQKCSLSLEIEIFFSIEIRRMCVLFFSYKNLYSRRKENQRKCLKFIYWYGQLLHISNKLLDIWLACWLLAVRSFFQLSITERLLLVRQIFRMNLTGSCDQHDRPGPTAFVSY